MKILGISLARGGSKSVPKKNIKKLNGIPLIEYTIKEALKSKYIDRYIISTDDLEIKKVSESCGAEVPFLRPSEFSQDTSSSVSALKHAVEWIENNEGIKYDYIIELMVTNPLKDVNDIDSCIEKLIKTNADSVIAVNRLEDHHPARIKKIVEDRIVDFCISEKNESRRQDLKPEAYIRSGCIYAIKRDHLMIENRRYGSKESRPYILNENKAINIDTIYDFMIAEQIIKNK
ncbi:MAG: acylneuraminate cytidylyltransferase family protein [Flavobacteriaceae bacterium]|jgi:CMP-N,N'-diacetyllegionaminic acid synthase|nr:acylneuraminate cytidylyltransferase family protein [Flavobacteriaceae bacterium]